MGALSLVLKFLFAPLLSAGICFVIGIRGTLFRDAVIQVLNLNPHTLFYFYLTQTKSALFQLLYVSLPGKISAWVG